MAIFVIKKDNNTYFDEFCGERNCSWTDKVECSVHFETRTKATYNCKKINKRYGYKVCSVEQISE